VDQEMKNNLTKQEILATSTSLVWFINATFNNISVFVYRSGKLHWWRKPPTCRKSLTNFIT
jgi:hypothetical protein